MIIPMMIMSMMRVRMRTMIMISIRIGKRSSRIRMSTRMHPAAVALLDQYRNRKGAAS
jgi:hypothetical protein